MINTNSFLPNSDAQPREKKETLNTKVACYSTNKPKNGDLVR